MWELQYMIARYKPEYTQDRRDQITIETIIMLHRARGESFQDNRSFYITHNPEDSEEVAIGFVEGSMQEHIFKLLCSEAVKVSNEVMDAVREILQ